MVLKLSRNHFQRPLSQLGVSKYTNMTTPSCFSTGLSKFARLARSVTRNRSVLMQFSSNVPSTTKVDTSKPSQIANVSVVLTTQTICHLYKSKQQTCCSLDTCTSRPSLKLSALDPFFRNKQFRPLRKLVSRVPWTMDSCLSPRCCCSPHCMVILGKVPVTWGTDRRRLPASQSSIALTSFPNGFPLNQPIENSVNVSRRRQTCKQRFLERFSYGKICPNLAYRPINKLIFKSLCKTERGLSLKFGP